MGSAEKSYRTRLMESSPQIEINNKRTFADSTISPQGQENKKSKFSMEDQLSQLTLQIANLTKEVSAIKSSSDTINITVTDIQSKLDGNIDITNEFKQMKQDMFVLKKENKLLKQQLHDINEKLSDMEYHQKRNNLVFEGFTESKDETNFDCFSKLMDLIGQFIDTKDMKVARCHRLGKKAVGYNRPIIANFLWYGDITKILSIKQQFPKGIYVKEDLPKMWEDKRRVLRPYSKIASTLNLRSVLTKDKLVINGVVYQVTDLNKLPIEVRSKLECEKQDEEKLVYFGPQSPFSNMHLCNFSVDNVPYNSVEQFFSKSEGRLLQR